jgi:stage V sporulation protein R
MMDFLTPKLVDDLNLYVFVQKETPATIDIVRTAHDAKEVRDLIVSTFAHSNIPKVEITNINYEDAGKLYLKHTWDGSDLNHEYAKKTLKHIHDLWGRDCLLETTINKEDKLLVIDSSDEIVEFEIKKPQDDKN